MKPYQDPFPIHYHLSQTAKASGLRRFRCLQQRLVDPSFHYGSPEQSRRWVQVFEAHSPVRGNPDFLRIYRQLFKALPASLPKQVHLIGLGCGTGHKEFWLAQTLRRAGIRVRFTAVDTSPDLILQSVQRLTPLLSSPPRGLATHLTSFSQMKSWLGFESETRLFTFFGVFPNFEPKQAFSFLKRLLRPQDHLLASAHLAPIQNESDYDSGCQKILPQYNNPETHHWLSALIQDWGLSSFVEPLQIRIEPLHQLRGVVASTRFRQACTIDSIRFRKGEILRVFFSIRYTPARFESLAKRYQLLPKKGLLTRCGQEGVWWLKAKP